jgi:hypothetical protein
VAVIAVVDFTGLKTAWLLWGCLRFLLPRMTAIGALASFRRLERIAAYHPLLKFKLGHHPQATGRSCGLPRTDAMRTAPAFRAKTGAASRRSAGVSSVEAVARAARKLNLWSAGFFGTDAHEHKSAGDKSHSAKIARTQSVRSTKAMAMIIAVP